jgi:hypothetical protein
MKKDDIQERMNKALQGADTVYFDNGTVEFDFWWKL